MLEENITHLSCQEAWLRLSLLTFGYRATSMLTFPVLMKRAGRTTHRKNYGVHAHQPLDEPSFLPLSEVRIQTSQQVSAADGQIDNQI